MELQLRGEHETNCAAAAKLWPVAADSGVGEYDGGWERFAVPADAVAPGNAPYSKSLLVRSRAPLLPPATCDALVAELEVELAAGRSDARYPLAGYTREARVADMAAGRTLLSDALVDRILPAAADQFGFRADRLRVNEALVVKYDAASGHNALPVHADFSLLTVNVGLSDSGEYGGGGTWFQHDGAVINCEQGHALVHAGGLVHAGVPVTRGTRHVLVLFLVGAEHPMLSGRMQAVGAAAGAKPVLGGAPREPRDLALSVAMLERAVKANPCELESWSQLGWNRRHAGDHAEALRCFEKAAALSGGRDFSALAEAASSQLALGRNDDALESARRALEVGPPPGPAETDERLEVTLRAGLALLALERHEEAGVVLDSILDEAPENSEAWAALGVAMAALGQEEAALSCQRQVLRIRAAEEYGSADAAREAEASDLAVEVATLPPLPDGRALEIESAKIVDAGTGGKLWLSAAVLCLAVVAPRRRPRRRRVGAGLRHRRRRAVRRRARRVARRADRRRPAGIAAARAGKRRRQCAAVRRRGAGARLLDGARRWATRRLATSSSLATSPTPRTRCRHSPPRSARLPTAAADESSSPTSAAWQTTTRRTRSSMGSSRQRRWRASALLRSTRRSCARAGCRCSRSRSIRRSTANASLANSTVRCSGLGYTLRGS